MESKISFCRNCGAQLDGSAKVCPQCGSKNTPPKRPVYEVPADWSELEIHFTPDLWAQENIVFVATH